MEMEIKKPSRSLTLKILLALSIVMALVFGGTLYQATNRTGKELTKLQESYSDHMATFIGQILRMAMETKDMDMLKGVLRDSAGNHGIVSIEVVNPGGVIIWGSDEKKQKTATLYNRRGSKDSQLK